MTPLHQDEAPMTATAMAAILAEIHRRAQETDSAFNGGIKWMAELHATQWEKATDRQATFAAQVAAQIARLEEARRGDAEHAAERNRRQTLLVGMIAVGVSLVTGVLGALVK